MLLSWVPRPEAVNTLALLLGPVAVQSTMVSAGWKRTAHLTCQERKGRGPSVP